jgi:hypothetical protein
VDRAERAVRADLLSKPEHRRIQANASKPKIKTGILANSKLADFYQNPKYKKWSNGNCFVGCTPIAAAIVFEYWDRDGYPKMIGSDSKNRSHSSETHDDVIAALDALRVEMRTSCDSDGYGATHPNSIDDGVESYARSRGYKKSTASNDKSSLWSAIKDEIDAGRPSMLTFEYDDEKTGEERAHTAVPYSYIDSTTNSDDSICVRTGWGSPTRKCYIVNSSTERWYIVTRIRPKK